ncbi:hypothetical protein MMC26_007535 [Xylographa opegraphella]|nr:hypothetical protein [Xylographa opegraphella]
MNSPVVLMSDHQHHLLPALPSNPVVLSPIDVSVPPFTNLGVVYTCPIANYFPPSTPTVPYDTFYQYYHQPPVTPGSGFASGTDSADTIDQQHAFIKRHQDLYIKAESTTTSQSITALPEVDADSRETNLGTHVDTLMRAIQVKTSVRVRSKYSLHEGLITRDENSIASGPHASMDNLPSLKTSEVRANKSYTCNIVSCAKHFFQKTHLDIHMRAHTGHKPFVSNNWVLCEMEL